MLQGLGVGQGRGVLDRSAVDDVAHGQFGDLAGDGARDVGHGQDYGRHVARGGVGTDGLADAVAEFVVQVDAVSQANKQDHAYVTVVVLADADRLDHLIELFDLAVDFGRTDAHAARIERRVRAAVDDHAAPFGQAGEIAVAPDPRMGLEVGRAVARAVVVVPEGNRHARKGLGAGQLAGLVDYDLAVVVADLDPQAQAPALQLTLVDRQQRIAQGKAGDNVRAAGNRAQLDVGLDVAVDVVEGFGQKWRAGRQDDFERIELVGLARLDARLVAGRDPLGAGAEDRHPGLVGQVPEHVPIRMEGRAVEQHDRRADREP